MGPDSTEGFALAESPIKSGRFKLAPHPDDRSDRELLQDWVTTKLQRVRAKSSANTPLDWLSYAIPAVGWLRKYRWLSEDLLHDVVAGISIAAMMVPHGLSYAKQNGGLPPVYGLYNGFVCVLIYFAFGTCRTLSVGPIAIIYGIMFNGLKDIDPGYLKIKDPNAPQGAAQVAALDNYTTMFLQVTLLCGFIQFVAWALRLSFLLQLLSRSIMSGFTTAVSVIFILSQLKSLFGYATTSSNRVYLQLYYLCKNIGNFQWKEFVMGFSILVLLFSLHFLSRRFPRRLKYARVFGPLIAMVLAIVITAAGRLDKHGIKIVGKIPRGLPPVTVDRLFPMEHFSKLFTVALTAAGVSLLDANAIGKVVASKNNYRTHNSSEFFAISLMNLVGPLFSATTTSGNFSRTAVWTQIGGKTQLAGFITAWLVALCLLVATEAFKYIPNNTLAAITIYGLVGLFDGQHLTYLWKVDKGDFLVWNVAFWVATMHSVELGLGLSIAASIALYILRSMFAPLRAQGVVHDGSSNTVYRTLQLYKDAVTEEGVPVVRLDADIYYGTVERLHDKIMKLIDASGANFIVLDLSPSAYIDPTGIHFLKDVFRNADLRSATVLLANPQPSFMVTIQKAGLLDSIHRLIFVSVADAIEFARLSSAEKGNDLEAAGFPEKA